MLLGLLAAVAASSLSGFFLLGGTPGRLLLDAGLFAAIAIITVVMLAPTTKRVDMMVDALRALSRGERNQRVNPDDFAGLSEVARALNEVAASLTENDDANLGPVRSTPREKPERPRASATASKARSLVDGEEADNNVGNVRRLKAVDVPSGPVSIGAVVASTRNKPSTKPNESASGDVDVSRPELRVPHNDTAIDGAPRSDASVPSDEGPPTLPTRAELDTLFVEFVNQKRAHDQAIADLDGDAFVQTILGECERLVFEHKCRGVKFEITLDDGEVSLRPRLLR